MILHLALHSLKFVGAVVVRLGNLGSVRLVRFLGRRWRRFVVCVRGVFLVSLSVRCVLWLYMYFVGGGGGACCLCPFSRSRIDVRFVRFVRELPFVLRTLGFVVVDSLLCMSWGMRVLGLFLWCFVSFLALWEKCWLGVGIWCSCSIVRFMRFVWFLPLRIFQS